MPPPMMTTLACAGIVAVMGLRKSISEIEGGDAEHHACRAGEARNAEAFLEPDGADEGGEEHGRLAQRGHGSHRCLRHRPEHDAVRREARSAAQHAAAEAACNVA